MHITTVLNVTLIFVFQISYYICFGLTRPSSGAYAIAKIVALSLQYVEHDIINRKIFRSLKKNHKITDSAMLRLVVRCGCCVWCRGVWVSTPRWVGVFCVMYRLPTHHRNKRSQLTTFWHEAAQVQTTTAISPWLALLRKKIRVFSRSDIVTPRQRTRRLCVSER
jgi:hypothetical protein